MPRRVKAPWGTITVPDDATDDEVLGILNSQDPGDSGPAGGGFVPPKPGLPDPRQQTKPRVPAFKVGDPQGETEASFGEKFVEAAYQTRPTKILEPDNIAGTAGAVTGAGLMATGYGAPFAIPAAMAVTGAVSKGIGGRENYFERLGSSEQDTDVLRDVALEGAGGVASVALPAAASQGGRWLYRKGLRVVADNPAIEDKLVETGIREGITVGRGGANKLQGTIKQLGGEVRKTLAALDDQTINPTTGLSNIRALRAEMARKGAQPNELSTIDNVLATYEQRFGSTRGMKPTEIQDAKVGIYERNAPQYDSDKLAGAGKRAEMEMARGFKTDLEDLSTKAGTPVGATNQRLADLYDLQEAVTSARKAGSGVQPGDITSLSFAGAPYTVARAGLRARPLTAVGRRLAKVGDSLDPRNVGGFFDKTEAEATEAAANATRKGDFDRLRAIRNQPVDFDSTVPVERPLGGQFEPDQLDRIGVPVERPQFPGKSSEDIAWERYMADKMATERAARESAGIARVQQGNERIGQWAAREAEPVQMSLGEAGPEFHQRPLGVPEEPHPIRLDDQSARPAGVAPQDRLMPNGRRPYYGPSSQELPQGWRVGGSNGQLVPDWPGEAMVRVGEQGLTVPPQPMSLVKAGPQGLSVRPTPPPPSRRAPSANIDMPGVGQRSRGSAGELTGQRGVRSLPPGEPPSPHGDPVDGLTENFIEPSRPFPQDRAPATGEIDTDALLRESELMERLESMRQVDPDAEVGPRGNFSGDQGGLAGSVEESGRGAAMEFWAVRRGARPRKLGGSADPNAFLSGLNPGESLAWKAPGTNDPLKLY